MSYSILANLQNLSRLPSLRITTISQDKVLSSHQLPCCSGGILWATTDIPFSIFSRSGSGSYWNVSTSCSVHLVTYYSPHLHHPYLPDLVGLVHFVPSSSEMKLEVPQCHHWIYMTTVSNWISFTLQWGGLRTRHMSTLLYQSTF